MKNKLGYLGFWGFIGLIGFTGNYYFFGFFGFFIYFRYFKVIPDELFKENVRKAATPGFFVSMTICALISGYMALVKNISLLDLAIGLTINFTLPVIVFTIILVYLEIREYSGEK